MKFIDFDLRCQLQELGCEPTFGSFHNWYFDANGCIVRATFGDTIAYLTALTIDQVLEWLRTKYNIHIVIDVNSRGLWYYLISRVGVSSHLNDLVFYHKSYDDCALRGIQYTLNKVLQ